MSAVQAIQEARRMTPDIPDIRLPQVNGWWRGGRVREAGLFGRLGKVDLLNSSHVDVSTLF
jgi:hypothetical protein